MKWSFRIGTLGGIEVRVHATFFLLILWLVFNYGLAGQGAGEIAVRVGMVLLLFGCVVLHEFGHAAAAARYGIRTRDITLLPIGGLARLESIPRNPRQELVVAIAGPAVNVVIALALGFLLVVLQEPLPTADFESLAPGALAWNLVAVNVFLVLFNLLPAFPMDGGRMLRALLAMRMPYVTATRRAATVGQGMALLFGFLGLFVNPFLILIAFFVWVGAGAEAAMVTMRETIADIPVGRAMVSSFRSLSPDDLLSRAVDMTLEGSQKDFPVLDDGRLVGLLSQQDMLGGLARGGRAGRVEETMQREVRVADADERLADALERFGGKPAMTVPVVSNGRVVGLLTMDNVSELLAIEKALDGRPIS